jgi:hypothetical protein
VNQQVKWRVECVLVKRVGSPVSPRGAQRLPKPSGSNHVAAVNLCWQLTAHSTQLPQQLHAMGWSTIRECVYRMYICCRSHEAGAVACLRPARATLSSALQWVLLGVWALS